MTTNEFTWQFVLRYLRALNFESTVTKYPMAENTYTVKALHLPCGAVEYSVSQMQIGDTLSGILAEQ